jgi:hypothetical protein
LGRPLAVSTGRRTADRSSKFWSLAMKPSKSDFAPT